MMMMMTETETTLSQHMTFNVTVGPYNKLVSDHAKCSVCVLNL